MPLKERWHYPLEDTREGEESEGIVELPVLGGGGATASAARGGEDPSAVEKNEAHAPEAFEFSPNDY